MRERGWGGGQRQYEERERERERGVGGSDRSKCKRVKWSAPGLALPMSV